MITLTYDPKEYSSHDSWIRYYKDVKQFTMQFKDDYKPLNPQWLWVAEKHKDGRPHLHCNVYLDTQVQQYPNSKSYRSRKFVFDSYHNYIKGNWSYGLTDVCAFYKEGLVHGLRYPLKYVFKCGLSPPDWFKLVLLYDSSNEMIEYVKPAIPGQNDPVTQQQDRPGYRSSTWWIAKQETLDDITWSGNTHVTQGRPGIDTKHKEYVKQKHGLPSDYVKLPMWRQSRGWPKLFYN